jgi:hypothetical protein
MFLPIVFGRFVRSAAFAAVVELGYAGTGGPAAVPGFAMSFALMRVSI